MLSLSIMLRSTRGVIVINKINSVLNNFWVALGLAVFSFFAAMIEAAAQNTGWFIADLVFSGYWLFIAWQSRRSVKTTDTSQELTQADIDTMIEIRDALNRSIVKGQKELNAKEKKK